jgi:hypothetical protein
MLHLSSVKSPFYLKLKTITMKKLHQTRKLVLKKSSVSNLSNHLAGKLRGGITVIPASDTDACSGGGGTDSNDCTYTQLPNYSCALSCNGYTCINTCQRTCTKVSGVLC